MNRGNILITGSNGSIGSLLLLRLLKSREYSLFSADIDESTHPHSEIRHFVLNNLDYSEIFNNVEINYVVHAGAQTQVSLAELDPMRTFDMNVRSTLNLLHALDMDKLNKFIYLNSGGSIYGNLSEIPYSELSPINPSGFYGISKFMGEELVKFVCERNSVSWVSLALSNVYGFPVKPNFPNIIIEKLRTESVLEIYGTNSTRDYIHVDDVIHAIECALKSDSTGRFNICSGIETSNIELATHIASLMNCELMFTANLPRQGEVHRSCLSNIKAMYELNWEPQISLSEGLASLLKM